MAESPEFLRVTHKKIPTRRQEDKDFVSRFIAFYLLGYQAYKSNMDIDTFVNESMQKLRNEINSEIVKTMKADFIRSLLTAEKAFGELKLLLGVDTFEAELILIDPKVKPSTENTENIKSFCDRLK